MTAAPSTFPRRPFFLAFAFAAALLHGGLNAGTYPATGTQGFTYANGTVTGSAIWNDGSLLSSTLTGEPPAPVASVQANALQLTKDGLASTNASFKLPVVDPGQDIRAFTATFTVKLFSSGTPGQGFAVSFGGIPEDDGDGELGWPLPNGLCVAWETFVDTAEGETQGEIVVYANNVRLTSYPQTFINDATFRAVSLTWDANGLDIKWAGEDIAVNLPVPGFVPSVGDRLAFSARTGEAATQEIALDSVKLTTTAGAAIVTGGPFISEFIADNKDSYEDDDIESSDWIEIGNGSSASVSLAGWHLTDDPANKTKWPLPSASLAANAYRVVFASGKNRSATSGQWHTNFTLPKSGGYLALVRPDQTIASEFTYGPQEEDIAYGEIGAARTRGYLETPTPGTRNVSLVGDGPPAGEVTFSRPGGILAFGESTSLSLSTPAAPGAVVRYSLTQSPPSDLSPVYAEPFAIENSADSRNNFTVRARVFMPGRLPGPVSSRTFLKIDSSLTNYNGSGQVFSSNIPVIVFDSHGVNVDGTTNPAAARPYRPTYAVVVAPDPVTGRASLSGPTDYQGRGGTHVRGESSSGFDQKSYAWETWNNEDEDKDEPILGMPAESDWVLHGPYSDKTLMRNYLMYSSFRDMRSDWVAPRTKFVEVFFNQQANQPVSYADYKGIYLLVEKIKRSNGRLGLAKINPLVTDANLITGGYIFKKDKASLGNTTWTSSRGVPLQGAGPDVLPTAQLNYLRGYVNSFENALHAASFADPVNGYAKWIDVPSFIDWQWGVEMSKQIDGYVFSTYFHKDRGGKMRASPMWDFNIALGNANYGEGEAPTGWDYDASRTATLTGQLWFPRLHQDPNYRVATFDRYWEMRNSAWSTEAIMGRIDAADALLRDGNDTPVTNNTATSVQTPAARHYRKYKIFGQAPWPNPSSATTRTTFQSEITYMKDWLAQRLAWMDNQFSVGSAAMRPPVMQREDLGNGSARVALSPYAGEYPGAHFPAGTLYYTTDGSDPRPSGYRLPTTQNVTLLPEYSDADWFIPTEANGGAAMPLEAWTGLAAPPNAASWTNSKLGIGFETAASSASNPFKYHIGGAHPNDTSWDGGTSNVQAQMLGISTSAFVRVPFTITADQKNRLVSLKVKVRYDDGFVVFINGREAVRHYVSPSSELGWSTTADARPNNFTDSRGATGETLDISHMLQHLQTGSNIMAVLGVNHSINDNDFLCAPSLTGTLGVAPSSPPAISAQTYSGPITLNASSQVKARLFVPETGMWSPLMNSTFVLGAVPAAKTNLVISEIHYTPLAPSAAELAGGAVEANEFEFIELLNTGGEIVDLTGVRLAGGVDFDFSSIELSQRTLPPGGRVVVCNKVAAFRLRYPDANIRVAGDFTGNLSNSGEVLTLLGSAGETLWSFAYGVAEPWPMVRDGSGSSIVFNNPTRKPVPDPALGSNWRPSATAHGAPGTANSVPFTLVADDDDDGDGLANFLEYVMGSDTASAASSAQIKAALSPAASQPSEPTVDLEVPLNLAADGYEIVIETSADLRTWAAPAASPVFTGYRRQADGSATGVWRIAVPESSIGVQIFFRVGAKKD